MADLVCWKHLMPYTARPQMHQHPFAEFYYCVAEAGSQVIPGKTVPMKPGDLFYFPANQWHIGNGPAAPGALGKGIVLYVPEAVFASPTGGDEETRRILRLLEALVRSTQNRVPLSAAASEKVRDCLIQVAEEIVYARPAYRSAAKMHLQHALLTILREGELPADLVQQHLLPQRELRMQQVCRYLETHYMHPISVDQLAGMTGLKHSQFHALFKQEMGCTCIDYLTRIRLQHALKLIRETPQPITRIAYRCGFPCISHFYQVFRSHSGKTPRQLRQSQAEPASA